MSYLQFHLSYLDERAAGLCGFITLCLCHLPVSDVDKLVFGYCQGEGGQVASTENPWDIGAHILQEGDAGRELMIDGTLYSD